MRNFIITYNIDNASNRTVFVEKFESILLELNFQKEITNQSTYFGAYSTKEALGKALYNAVSKLDWKINDVVTIYYPKVTHAKPSNIPDIGKHLFKSEGNNILNFNII